MARTLLLNVVHMKGNYLRGLQGVTLSCLR